MLENTLEIFFLSAAVSVDAFAACFSLGLRRVKMPPFSVLILSFISAAFLSLSLFAGTALSSLLPVELTKKISFLILFILGLSKLFERCDETADKANKNHDNLLSTKEAFFLGLALSLDSLAAGLGTGMITDSLRPLLAEIILIPFSLSAVFIVLGSFLGKMLSTRLGGNFCRLGGLLLIALAFFQFF